MNKKLTIRAKYSTICPFRNGSLYGILSVLLIFFSCSTEPEPLAYGVDVCHFCKMTLMDSKFGAELVTTKGKVYKFDDLNCFLNYYNSGSEEERAIAHKLVVDYSKPGTLINATEAFYLKSSEVHSPMNGGIAAFETKSDMDNFKKQWRGIYLGWGEVVTQFK